MINKIKVVFFNVAKKGFFHLLSANLVLQFAGFSSQFFIAGFLSSTDLGRIKIMQSIIQLMVVVAGIGLNSSVLKLCSEGRGEKDVNSIYFSGLIITFFSTLVFYLVLLEFAFYGAISSDDIINKVMCIFGLAIIPIALNNYHTSYYQALKKIKEIAKIQVTTKIITLIAIVLCTYYFYLFGFIFATLIGFVLTSTYFLLLSKKSFFCGYNNLRSIKALINYAKEHVYYAKYSTFANVSGQFSIVADIIFINYLVEDRSSIGQYAFALTLVLLLDLLLSTIQQISAPYFSSKENDRLAFLSSFKKYQNYLYIIVCLLPIIVFILFSYMVPHLFSGKYSLALQLLPILLLAWCLRALFALKGVAFWGGGFVRVSSLLGVVNMVISIPLLYIGAHNGIFGVAFAKFLATLIAYTTVSVTFYFTYYKSNLDHAN